MTEQPPPDIPPDIPPARLEPAPDTMSAQAATPVSDVDRQLTRNLKQAHRARWITVAGLGLLLLAAVATMGFVIAAQQSELQSSCSVWRLLSPQPVTILKGSNKPTQLSVSIIAASRAAFVGQHCGTLPPANPLLVKWAKIYGVPLP